MFGALAGGDTGGLQAMFGQLQRMFTPHEGTVNWDMARDLARKSVAQAGDRSPNAGDQSRLLDTARLAEHWLDGVTDFPAVGSTVAAWSRAEWVESSIPAWRELVEPVAESVVGAMGKALPPEAQAMAGPMMGMLTQLGGAMFSQQIGQAIGALSHEVVSATDIGFPVNAEGKPALVIDNARSFGEGLDVDDNDVSLYLMLRECASQRLFAAAPWLREYLFAAIADYGRGISIDTSAIEEKMSSLDPTNLAGMQEAMSGGLFDLEQTPDQRAALTRLETALTLVEGWIDEVVGQATDQVMPQAQALREAVRRRRATGGPAEATFAALVGLELRPRRLRDASALWGALRAAEGSAARDAVWAHPHLMPTAADLDDPLAFAQRTREADEIDVESADFDAQLTALLKEGSDGESHDERDS
jgi:putative hydrolase